MEEGKMYTVVVYGYRKERTVQTYATSLDEAIQKAQRARFKVDKVKTTELNK